MGGRGWVSRENIVVASPVLKKLICSVEPNKASSIRKKTNRKVTRRKKGNSLLRESLSFI
jgi:hypothetical protein